MVRKATDRRKEMRQQDYEGHWK